MHLYDKFAPRGIFAPRGKSSPRDKLMRINGVLENIFTFFFFAEFVLLMIHNNILKSSEKLTKRNLLKFCLQVTYLTDFCIICIHFLMGKV